MDFNGNIILVRVFLVFNYMLFELLRKINELLDVSVNLYQIIINLFNECVSLGLATLSLRGRTLIPHITHSCEGQRAFKLRSKCSSGDQSHSWSTFLKNN